MMVRRPCHGSYARPYDSVTINRNAPHASHIPFVNLGNLQRNRRTAGQIRVNPEYTQEGALLRCYRLALTGKTFSRRNFVFSKSRRVRRMASAAGGLNMLCTRYRGDSGDVSGGWYSVQLVLGQLFGRTSGLIGWTLESVRCSASQLTSHHS